MNIAALFAAFAFSAAFFAVQGRVPSPLVRMELFRNRPLVAGLSANMMVSTVMMATLIVGPFYLTKVMALTPATAGLILAIGPLVAAIAGIPAGRLVDRFGAARAALGGLTALAMGAVALSVVPSAFGVAGYVVPIVTMTTGYALFQAANNAKIMSGSDIAERGVVSGILNLSRNLGLVTGASAMGAIFAWGTVVHDVMRASPQAISKGMHATFTVAAILIAISLLISWRGIGKQRRQD